MQIKLSNEENIVNFEENAPNKGLRRSIREKIILPELQDYLCNTVRHSLESYSVSALPSSTAAPSKSLYPVTNYLICDKFSYPHKYFLASITAKTEPIKYSDVVSNPK